jgi:hypothetical protein
MMHLPKERRFSFWFGLALLSLLSLGWKPESILAWRLTHMNSASVGDREVQIPFPWVLARPKSPIKASTFSTLWPTLENDDYLTAILEEEPHAQRTEADDVWFLDREARFRAAGYSDIHRESYGPKSILCSIASINKTDVAYCRAKSNLTLIYSGSKLQLPRALALLQLE